MEKYQIDPELRILKPLKFKKYTNTRRFIANFILRISWFFTRPKKGVKQRHFWIRGYEHMKIKILCIH